VVPSRSRTDSFFNLTTTAVTVAVAVLVAVVYASGLASPFLGWTWLNPIAGLAEQIEILGFGIAGLFIATWITAATMWRFSGPTGPGPGSCGESLEGLEGITDVTDYQRPEQMKGNAWGFLSKQRP
jgi:hypothetical protein